MTTAMPWAVAILSRSGYSKRIFCHFGDLFLTISRSSPTIFDQMKVAQNQRF